MPHADDLPALQPLADALLEHGMILRGGFAFAAGEDAPPGPSGAPARAALLVGHGGPSIWPHFSAWRELQPADVEHPLDAWSRSVIAGVAAAAGARAVFPSDRPYLPFQQWAMRAEGLRPSPLGILMHPSFGLWHAYRGALLFEDGAIAAGIGATSPAQAVHLCDACSGKPCLAACPVSAHSGEGFAYQDCLAHVRSVGGGTCRTSGCLDRNACPEGHDFRYGREQIAFHMRAFARAT